MLLVSHINLTNQMHLLTPLNMTLVLWVPFDSKGSRKTDLSLVHSRDELYCMCRVLRSRLGVGLSITYRVKLRIFCDNLLECGQVFWTRQVSGATINNRTLAWGTRASTEIFWFGFSWMPLCGCFGNNTIEGGLLEARVYPVIWCSWDVIHRIRILVSAFSLEAFLFLSNLVVMAQNKPEA